MIRLMTEPIEQDELLREAEIVLRDNRIALVRSEGVGERMMVAWDRYTRSVDNILCRIGVELSPPSERQRRPRWYCRAYPRG